MKTILHALAATSAAILTTAANAATLDLAGTGADGYLAVVGFNQDGNTTLSAIDRDPTSATFFDYPAYVNPEVPANIYLMSVEPYRFGLSYPDPLHPTGPGTFASVGTLQPASQAGQPGVTFIEGVTEDADFEQTDIGQFDFDGSSITGVGVETIAAASLSLTLDGSEFESINRTDLATPFDFPPFGPEGRSNFNELASLVTLTATNLAGTGLTFTDGLLTSIDLTADVDVLVGSPALPPGLGFTASGTLSFTGATFAFDVDGQSSLPFNIADDVRVLLNRSGVVSAVGVLSIPEPGAAALLFGLLTTLAVGARSRRVC